MSEGVAFGKYQLLRLVGAGGMAEVHLARQIGPLGYVKPCVVKRIAPQYAGRDSFRRMFLEEARISALLNHPHIVQTFEFGDVDGTPFLAMELVDGMNVAVLCRGLAKLERWIPLRAAIEIMSQVSDALAYAHALVGLDGRPLNLVHRDVSPQNVLVSRLGGVKLADFGIARHDARDEHTQAGHPKGKPGYMAPEQAMGQDVDHRADLFAAGIMLTELVTARRVTRRDAPGGILAVPRRVADLWSLRPEAPPSLRALALAATALEPGQRPGSAREVAEALRSCAESLPPADGLQRFVDRVFNRYFPAESLREGTSASSFSPPDPQARSGLSRTSLDPPPGLPPPPPDSSVMELSFVSDAWAQPAPAAAPVSAFAGWPSEFLDVAPPALALPRAQPDAAPFQPWSVPPPPPAPPLPPLPPPDATRAPPPRPESTKGPRPRWGEAEFELEPTAVEPPIDTTRASRPPSRGAQRAALSSPDIVAPIAEPELDRPAPLPSAVEPARKKRPIPPKLLYGAAAAAFVLLLVVLRALTSGGEDAPRAAISGRISVTSVPAGALIKVDGQDTGKRTPAVLERIEPNTPTRITVDHPGHVSRTGEVVVQLSPGQAEGIAHFELTSARSFRIETDPPGASLTLDGRALRAWTPSDLPPIARGESATVTVALVGHMPRKIVLETDTASVVQLALQPSKKVSIVTDPPSARVFVDDYDAGVSPLDGVDVPAAGAFTVRVEKAGFKRVKKTYQGKRVTDGDTFELALQDLPLSALPMDRHEREMARGLERALTRAQNALIAATNELRRAESELERVNAEPQVFVDVTAKAQKRVDTASSQLESAETAKDEAQAAYDAFKTGIFERVSAAER